MLPRHGEAHVRTKSGQTCPCGKPSVRLSWFHHCEPFTKRKKAYAMPYRYFLMGLCWVVLVVLAIPMQAQSSCENPLQDAEWSSSWDLTDFCQFQAGVFDEMDVIIPRDAIRPIDAPTFDSLLVADGWLAPQSPVIALEYMGEARAYPLAMMSRHEIVNDEIAGVPIAVTYCPLCNSAIVFVRDVDGVTLRFGTTGMLRKSDLIMWDDVTESWWQQFTGEGIVGTYTGELLEIVPSLLVGYGAFKARYPDGVVLSQGDYIYGRQNYFEYDSQERPFAFNEALDTRLPQPSACWRILRMMMRWLILLVCLRQRPSLMTALVGVMSWHFGKQANSAPRIRASLIYRAMWVWRRSMNARWKMARHSYLSAMK
jgi:hypothetical protein